MPALSPPPLQRDVCAGCLGTTACWICLGQGILPSPTNDPGLLCSRCLGTRWCHVCSDREIQRALVDQQAAVVL